MFIILLLEETVKKHDKIKQMEVKIVVYYPNQKQITIHREMVNKNSMRLFLCVYQDNLTTACKVLTHSGFKVYVALLFSKDGFSLEFSPKYISQITGLCLDTIRKSFRELQKKGFIIPANETETLFDFYETPQKRSKINIVREKRRFVDNDSGELLELSYAELLECIGNEAEAKQVWEDAKNDNYSK